MVDTLPRSDDLEATWNFIEPGINQILGDEDAPTASSKKRVDKVLSPTMYMEVYTAIYNYCVNRSRSSGQFASDKPSSQTSILVGSEIYERLKAFLRKYISNFHRMPNESFLKFYVRHWKRFTVGAIFLNHTFDYMNRYWVQKERSDGKRHIFDVNTLCLMTWKEVLFVPNSTTLVNEILDQITLERDGNIIQRDEIITAIKSFVVLGIDPQDLKKLSLNVYIQSFEKPLLLRTEEYYRKYSNDYLQTHSITDYIFEVHDILNREEKGMAMYWDDHTKKLLSETLNVVLIKEHIGKLEADFVTLLDSRDNNKITVLYKLMQRDFTLLPKLAAAYEAYIKNCGESEISQLIVSHRAAVLSAQESATAAGKKISNASVGALPPKDYIKKLLEVYFTFRKLTSKCFNNDPLFMKSMDNACRSYINVNEFALPPGSARSATSRTPEMLAKYSDQLLKRSTKPEISSDMSIDDIIIIFKFLTDKDAFESHYRRLFAKRLIHGTSTCDEDEEAVIQRLQSENSMEYTGKITKMFQDVRLSKILENDFNAMMRKSPEFSTGKYPALQPFVLAENMWPFTYTEGEINIPEELETSYKSLEQLYTSKHNGRILKWLWQLCRGELVANIGKPGRPPFVFTVTLFQMVILLQFNDSDVRTLEELQENTNLSPQNIAASMVPFIKFKLIQQTPPGLQALINPQTQFKLMQPYKALKTNINFAAGVKNDILNSLSSANKANNHKLFGDGRGRNMTENERIERELNSERQIFLEACIIRIMKAKRRLPHTTLVNECIAQSHQRFNAKIAMIKRAIDSLIQKGYLQRCDDGESYSYLA